MTLARELSLAEVRAIRAATACELEIFVHGALCVAYSGPVLLLGGVGRTQRQSRPVRAGLPAAVRDAGGWRTVRRWRDARYLLSPGDLYALGQIPEIVEIGIAALKIEGRYKDADYVALTTRAYRKAVDDAWAGRAAVRRTRRANCSSNRSTRAASGPTSSPARITRRWSTGAPRGIAAC